MYWNQDFILLVFFWTADAVKQSLVSVPGMSSGTVLGAGSIGTEIANEILELQR